MKAILAYLQVQLLEDGSSFSLQGLYIDPELIESTSSEALHMQFSALHLLDAGARRVLPDFVLFRVRGVEWRKHRSLWTPMPQKETLVWWCDEFVQGPWKPESSGVLAREMAERWGTGRFAF